MSSGFYEGGYSGYGGNTGGASGSGSSYNNYNASSGGGGGSSSNAFSGSMGGTMGSSSTSAPYSQTQPMQRPNAATSQQQYNQQQNYGQQPQQQPQQQQSNNNPNSMDNFMSNTMNMWNPAVASVVTNTVMGGGGGTSQKIMEDMGRKFLEESWAQAIPGLERIMTALRPYFAVDNSYVKRKMTRVLFPFVFREWARNEIEPNPDGSMTYALPQQDDNAPDLYIPAMALLTYVLLCALCYGNAGKFDPDVLPDVMSKCVVTQILEVIAIRIGFYLMEASVSILDLVSYTSYKYLGLSVNMLSGLTMGHFLGYGHRSYYLTYLWTATAVSYFILKVMANCIPRRTSAVGPKRQFMVLGFAGSQFATCWFVSQTKFLE